MSPVAVIVSFQYLHYGGEVQSLKATKDYKKLVDTPLPRAKPVRKGDTLYELEILEEDTTNGRVKVHYTGYGSEWRDKNDVVEMEPSKQGKYIATFDHSHCTTLSILQKFVSHFTSTMNYLIRSRLP